MVAASYRRGRANRRGLNAISEIPHSLLPEPPLVAPHKDATASPTVASLFEASRATQLVKSAGNALFWGFTLFVGLVTGTLGKGCHLPPASLDRLTQPAMPRSRPATEPHARVKRVKKLAFKRSPTSTRRSAKLKHKRSLWRIRLAAIANERIPDVTRLSIARSLPSYQKIYPKLRELYYADLLQLLLAVSVISEIECSMLCRVLRLAFRLSGSSPLGMLVAEESAALTVIECPDATTAQRVHAFFVLSKILYLTAADPVRVVEACSDVLGRHADPVTYRELWRHLVTCMELALIQESEHGERHEELPAIGAVLAHDSAPLGLLLTALARCGDEKTDHVLKESLCGAVECILAIGSDQQRASMIDHHYEQIKRALPHMCWWHIIELMDYDDYVAIAMHTPAFLRRLFVGLHEEEGPEEGLEEGPEEWELAQIAAALMRYACEVNDNARLEDLLGLDFIMSARALVQMQGTCFGPTFENILNLHPEWADYFKMITKDGVPANEITSVVMRIPDRPKLPPTLYVLEEPEQQEEPSQATVVSRPSTVSKQEPPAEQQDSSDEDVATFVDLPPHFLEQVARSMTFADLVAFRSSCRQALDAVGRSLRALDIVRLAQQLWPEKHAPGITIFSLYSMQNEMVLLAAWHRLDLITTIDFAGVGTMNASQLEIAFGTEPRNNVKKVGLAGVVVMPTVWTILARIFPGINNVRCTESACQFPASIKREAMLMDGEKVGGMDLVDRKELRKRGLLSEERIITLRCIKLVFPAACYLYLD